MSNNAFPAAIAPVVFETDCQPALPASWVWQGILSRGHITLLTSQWKSGKSTLLSLLLGGWRRQVLEPV